MFKKPPIFSSLARQKDVCSTQIDRNFDAYPPVPQNIDPNYQQQYEQQQYDPKPRIPPHQYQQRVQYEDNSYSPQPLPDHQYHQYYDQYQYHSTQSTPESDHSYGGSRSPPSSSRNYSPPPVPVYVNNYGKDDHSSPDHYSSQYQPFKPYINHQEGNEQLKNMCHLTFSLMIKLGKDSISETDVK